MKDIKHKLNNKKGSMMLEAMVITVVGLIILSAFMGFLDQGSIFASGSINVFRSMEKAEDSRATLGTFSRIE